MVQPCSLLQKFCHLLRNQDPTADAALEDLMSSVDKSLSQERQDESDTLPIRHGVFL